MDTADYIKYDYGTIRTALDDMATKHGVLLAQADSIRTEQRKFDNAWEDEESATAYQAVQTKWNESFSDINDLLQRVKAAAENAVVSMQQTNSKAAAGWQG
ncbi:WXG100 family type VII secretion target [Tsukamurella sp. 1534]|uniref:WXG100 family type VII secretion target n=1 Tax=Tsukamurella sp. 1534 TaxID=1151061 RepID=UPI0002F9E8BF|nr:WXG100 family type VII secretion target [Tsukamurella sp. 1534]